MALRLILVLCVSRAVPRAGSSSELSVLWSPGMTSQKTGAAHGPRHPSCPNNQDISASSQESSLVFGNVTAKGFLVSLLVGNGDDSLN